MSNPFLAEIHIMAFNFAPLGYALCDGQLLPIAQNPALFALLGTTYGGDGMTTFALPDLRGRTPIHKSISHPLSQKAGAESHSLAVSELPSHSHSLAVADTSGNTPIPNGSSLAAHNNGFGAPSAPTDLAAGSITTQGGAQGHANLQPFVTINFCIAISGVFPT